MDGSEPGALVAAAGPAGGAQGPWDVPATSGAGLRSGTPGDVCGPGAESALNSGLSSRPRASVQNLSSVGAENPDVLPAQQGTCGIHKGDLMSKCNCGYLLYMVYLDHLDLNSYFHPPKSNDSRRS